MCLLLSLMCINIVRVQSYIYLGILSLSSHCFALLYCSFLFSTYMNRNFVLMIDIGEYGRCFKQIYTNVGSMFPSLRFVPLSKKGTYRIAIYNCLSHELQFSFYKRGFKNCPSQSKVFIPI